MQLFADGAGGPNEGFGIYFAGSWAHSVRPRDWVRQEVVRDMTFLELFTVHVALLLWCDVIGFKISVFCSTLTIWQWNRSSIPSHLNPLEACNLSEE